MVYLAVGYALGPGGDPTANGEISAADSRTCA